MDSNFNQRMATHKRHPSPQLASKIADNLPAPAEIKYGLLENMELAHVYAVSRQFASRMYNDHQLLNSQLSDLEEMHRRATFGKDAREVQLDYRTLRDASYDLLQQIDPEQFPDSFAQICLYYHDAQCVLNRPDEALVYAKIAQLVLESIETIEEGYTQVQRRHFEINTIRGEAVAYHNLKLDKLVPDILLNRVCRTSAYAYERSFWEPIVMRDLVNSVVEFPRFSIREVNRIAYRIQSICERNDDQFTLLLVREAWLRSLIKFDKTKLAGNVLEEEIGRLPHLPYVGALHKALLFKSGARLAWQTHDRDAWNVYMRQALDLMTQAGLKHQLEQTREMYGSAVESLL
ncbi:MAG: hypothetical protein L0287_14775 [Anaerolineae bacterium]|nr:hypothetical protein [Anaerolineae bacterium]